jgi:hypothetical protein
MRLVNERRSDRDIKFIDLRKQPTFYRDGKYVDNPSHFNP